MSRAQNLIGKSINVGSFLVNVKEKIGEGGYAIVYRCADQQGQEYALKSVNCLSDDRFEQFKQEAILLQSIPSHPNIIRLYAADINSSNMYINFLFELCPTTAIDMMMRRLLSREEILVFFYAISSAVAFLHSQKPPIVHRDIKPENLLVGLDGYPKLCDFGSATTKIYQIDEQTQINPIQDDIEKNTTQNYRSPEMIDFFTKGYIGPPSDVWALGCTLYKLIYRDDLFKPDERLPILQARINLPSDIDNEFAKIIHSCIQINPNQRPTASDIAAIVLSLRGQNEKIAISTKSSSSSSQSPKTDDLHWYNYVKEQYRSWVASGVQKWAIKATFPSLNPPKTKHVRRVIAASIRHTEITPEKLINFFLMQRPWQTDCTIAVKVVYLILQLSQYSTNLSLICNMSGQISQVGEFYTQNPALKKPWSECTIALSNLLKAKLAFHNNNHEFEGNLAFGSRELKREKAEAIRNYVLCITPIAAQLLKISTREDCFSLIVITQPAIDEVANAYALLRYVNVSAVDELSAAGKLLNEARKVTYLESSVEYPVDVKKPPLQRFVADNVAV